MSSSIGFSSFLMRYQYVPRDAFTKEFPLGCLLTSNNPTRSSQCAAAVYPLRKQGGGPAPELVAVGDGEDARASRITVGRGSGNDVVIAAATVSKAHAYFTVVRGRLCVVDTGSSNGTMVHGKLLEANRRAFLDPGINEVWFGEEKLFLFDGVALFDYLSYLGKLEKKKPEGARATPAAPRPEPVDPLAETQVPDEVSTTRKARAIPAGAALAQTGATQVVDTALAELREQEDKDLADQKWTAAMNAVKQLLGNAERLEAFLSVNPAPIPIYQADQPMPVDRVLHTLEGLRWVVERVKLTFKHSKYELVVFEK